MAGEESKKVKARVLTDCSYGKANSVVEVTAEEAKANKDRLDSHPSAVKYAEELAEEAEADAKRAKRNK